MSKTSRFTKRTAVVLIVVIVAVAAVGAYFVFQSGQQATGKPKLAMIISGPVSDSDYEALGYLALQTLHNTTGVETAYSENVNPADTGTAVSQYISQGFTIIWTHGAEFTSAIGPGESDNGIAAQNPKTTFIVETDIPPNVTRPNVWVIDRNYMPGMYAMGAAATLATHSGVIAYIGGLQLPFSYAEVNAIKLAVQTYKSSVKFYRYWTDDFFDPVKASSATRALVSQGADVIINSLNLGYFGIVQTINGTNILVTAKYTDKSSFSPHNFLTSFVFNFASPLLYVYNQIASGQQTGYYKLKFGSDTNVVLPLHNVPDALSTQMSSIVSNLTSGSIVVPFNATNPGPGP